MLADALNEAALEFVSMVAMDMHRDIPGRDKLPDDDKAEGGTDSLLNAEAARDMDVMDMPIISAFLLLAVLTDRISVGMETSSEPRLYMESLDRRRGTPLITVLVLARTDDGKTSRLFAFSWKETPAPGQRRRAPRF